MRVLAVTHGALVGPALFAEVITAEGHALLEWRIEQQGPPPAAGYDAVMVFGGDQNVGEELEHPWLHEEYDALGRWVAAGTPLLAVCLGAQTLAHALGATVSRLPSWSLAGFYETNLTAEGIDDPVLGVLPARFDALNANAYALTVPEDAVELARGPVTQAFRAGDRAWAVQFHPEVYRDQVLGWFVDDAADHGKPLDLLERELDEKLPAWQEHGRALCRAFLQASVSNGSSSWRDHSCHEPT
jgi:GMP synthase-like glutamine amidotransferase